MSMFSSTLFKAIMFPLVDKEAQIQHQKSCDKCGVKLPVGAACVVLQKRKNMKTKIVLLQMMFLCVLLYVQSTCH